MQENLKFEDLLVFTEMQQSRETCPLVERYLGKVHPREREEEEDWQ